MLFFAGWYEWYVALPLIVGMAVGMLVLDRQCRGWVWRLSRYDVLKLLCVFFLIGVQQFAVGYTGDVCQHGDFWQRNAFYGNLISYAWPIILPDGAEMSYYLAGWLPAALVCKLLAHCGANVECIYGVPGYVLLCWNIAALGIASLILCRIWGRVSILALLGVYIFGDVMVMFGKLPVLSSWLAAFPEDSRILPIYWNVAAGFPGSVQILPLTVLAVACLLVRGLPFWAYLFIGAMLFLISPLASVGAFPFVVYLAFRALAESEPVDGGLACGYGAFRSLKCGWTYVAFAVVAAGFLYYSRAESSSCYWSLGLDTRPGAWVAFGLYMLTNVLVLGLIPWRYDRRNPLLYLAVAVLVALPFFYMGDICNELAMKGATVPVVILGVLSASVLLKERRCRRDPWVLLVVGLCALKMAGHVYHRAVLVFDSWGKTEQNVIDPFRGHLFHPGTRLNQSIRPTSRPLLPCVLLSKAGESERGLLFWLQTPASDKYFSAPYRQKAGYPPLDKPLPTRPCPKR